MQRSLLARFQRWVVGALAIGALVYLGGSIWAGFDEVSAALLTFDWRYLVPLVGLTAVNYGLRFLKWHYLLGRLGVKMPLGEDAWTFIAGLSMAISPGKAGELLKPYVVQARTGAPMARTIPALIGERLTDGVAMLVIAAFGVSTYASEQTGPLVGLGLAVAGGLVVLSSRRLMHGALDLMDRLPLVSRISPRLRLMVDAAQTCLAPRPLLFTVALSVVAWLAECVAYWQTFAGFGVPVDAAGAIYIYASSTILGAPSPGGLGVTDGAMAVGAMTILGVERGVAVPAALIARTVTLWMGVLLGALALIRVSALLGGDIALEGRAPPPAAE
ncbi:MAG: flippase-like domain-containing protein [Deltaproteobacteria bacterium]|jgi:uncharacterized protein (TIRG00374 family)|nr:flippase-like domain-containing protein [Deltaproteobacteria bacterium]